MTKDCKNQHKICFFAVFPRPTRLYSLFSTESRKTILIPNFYLWNTNVHDASRDQRKCWALLQGREAFLSSFIILSTNLGGSLVTSSPSGERSRNFSRVSVRVNPVHREMSKWLLLHGEFLWPRLCRPVVCRLQRVLHPESAAAKLGGVNLCQHRRTALFARGFLFTALELKALLQSFASSLCVSFLLSSFRAILRGLVN